MLTLAAIAALALAANKFLSAKEVFTVLRRFEWGFALPIVGASVLSLVFGALRFIVLLRPLTDVPGWAIARGYIGAQPATVLPGGVVARAAILRQLGVPGSKTSAPVLHSSLMDQVVLVLTTAIAALWFREARFVAAIALGVIALIALLFLLPVPRHWVSRRLGALLARVGLRRNWGQFHAALGAINHRGTIIAAFGLSIAALACSALQFFLCLRGIGVNVPFWTALLGYALPALAGRLFITPGGLGVTESGIVGLLHKVAGVGLNSAAAGAALFRLSDSVLKGLIGVVVYLLFWHGERQAAWLGRVRGQGKEVEGDGLQYPLEVAG